MRAHTMTEPSSPDTHRVLTYREIGQRSFGLLKETERTTNHYVRAYVHRKFPNIPIVRLAIFGKIAGLAISAGIAYYKLSEYRDGPKEN